MKNKKAKTGWGGHAVLGGHRVFEWPAEETKDGSGNETCEARAAVEWGIKAGLVVAPVGLPFEMVKEEGDPAPKRRMKVTPAVQKALLDAEERLAKVKTELLPQRLALAKCIDYYPVTKRLRGAGFGFREIAEWYREHGLFFKEHTLAQFQEREDGKK